jgi:hypothetical protein
VVAMVSDYPSTSCEYRQIPDHPSVYVGEEGSVWRRNGWRSRRQGVWHQLKPKLRGRCGRYYQRVYLGPGVTRSVHHLVLELFVGPRPPGMECRHLDGNPQNNHRSNLAWGTSKENVADQYLHGTRRRRAVA